MAVRGGDIPFANTHAAMSPALMRDLKNRLTAARSLERLSSMDSDKKPSLVFSGRTSSQSSTRSSMRSIHSSTSDIPGSLINSHNSEKNLERTASVNLPRIPSKVLKERGSSTTKRTAKDAHHGDEHSDNKGRKLSETSSSAGSTPRDRETSRGVAAELEKENSLQRQTSMSSAQSAASSKRSSFSLERSSSLAASFKRSGRTDGETREETAGVALRRLSRQSSTASDKDRSSTGYGVLQMASQSRRSSSAAASSITEEKPRKISKNRPSFQTINGSSTPGLMRTSPRSSVSSAASLSLPPPSPPPPPLAMTSSSDVAASVWRSSPSPPLPSPPPIQAPDAFHATSSRSWTTSAEPLPTPPPTTSHHVEVSLPLPSPPPDVTHSTVLQMHSSSAHVPPLDLPPPSPPASPALSSSSSSSSSSSTKEKKQKTSVLEQTTAWKNDTTINQAEMQSLAQSQVSAGDDVTTAPVNLLTLSHSAAAAVIHFPPPPNYPPPSSPSQPSPRPLSHSTQTSPASLTPRSGLGEGHLDPSDRLTSTSTDVVLRYLDNTLDPYSSLPVTPSLNFTDLPTPTSPAFQSPVPSPARASKNLEGRFDSKRSKGDKLAKRRLSSTQTTKYEGSVKTIRKQIKPGHVDVLRNMFIAQDESDDEVPRHGRRRLGGRRSSNIDDGNSDDDSGSGYTTTSSDNEYDLEHAEWINSPEYRPDVVFTSLHGAETLSGGSENGLESSMTANKHPGLFPGGAVNEEGRKEGAGFTGKALLKTGTGINRAMGAVVEIIQAEKLHTPPPTPPPAPFTVTVAAPLPHSLNPPTIDDPPNEHTPTHVTLSKSLHLDNKHATTPANNSLPDTPSSVRALIRNFQTTAQGGAETANGSDLRLGTGSSVEKSSMQDVRENRSRFLVEPILPVEQLSGQGSRDHRDKETALGDDLDKHEGLKNKAKFKEAEGGVMTVDKKTSVQLARGASSPASQAVEVRATRGREQEWEGGRRGSHREGGGHVTQPPLNEFRPVDDATRAGIAKAEQEEGERCSDSDQSERRLSAKRSRESSTSSDESERGSTESGGDEGLAQRKFVVATPALSVHPPAHEDRFGPQIPSQNFRSSEADDTKLLEAAAENRTTAPQQDAQTGGQISEDFLSILNDIHTKSETVSSTTSIGKARELQNYTHNKNSLNLSSAAVEKKTENDSLRQKGSAFVELNTDDVFTEDSNRLVQSKDSTDIKVETEAGEKPAGNATEEVNGIKDKMAAAVGEVTSFTLRRDWKGRGHSSSSSSSDSSAKSSRGMEENAADVYVYQDSRGDVYLMQDVTDQAPTSSLSTTTTATAFAKPGSDNSSINSGTASFHFKGLDSSESVTLDTGSVDVHKAKEVISAFFSDQASAQQRHQQGLQYQQQDHRSLGTHAQFGQDSTARDSNFSMLAGNVGLERQVSGNRSYASNEMWTASGTAGYGTGQVRGGSQDVHRSNSGSYITTVTFPAGGGISGQKGAQPQNQHLTNSFSHSASTGLANNQLNGQSWGGAASSAWSGQQGHQQQQQHQSSSFTVSTTSTAVVGEESKLKIHIPPNAVPVLPTHVLSPTKVRDINPIMLDAGPSFQSTLKPRSDAGNRKQSQTRRDSDSSLSSEDERDGRARYRASNLRTAENEEQCQFYVTSARSGMQGAGVGKAYDGAEQYTSKTYATDDKRASENLSKFSEWEREESHRVSNSQLISGVTSREEPHFSNGYSGNNMDRQARYVISGLRRTDSNRGSHTEESLGRRDSNVEKAFDGHSSYSDAKYISRVNIKGSNSFADNDDSLYGSQTSKATSLVDMSPIDEPTYKFHRAEMSQTSTQPLPEKRTIYTTVDKTSRATRDYHQRALNRSQERLFRQKHAHDVWRVDHMSRSVPDLSLPLLERSFPSHEDDEENSAQKYRLVRTSHSGMSVSSDSDSDSGVGDNSNRRYRAVTRVEVGSDRYRRRLNSTGSLVSTGLSLRPRSPSPPAREYRVSSMESQSSWALRKEEERGEDGRTYRVVQMAPSEDKPPRHETKIFQGTGDGGKRRISSKSSDDDSPDDRNGRPFRVVRTSSSERLLTDESSRGIKGYTEGNRYSAPLHLDSGFFDADLARNGRPSSSYYPSPTAVAPTGTGPHKTVITLDVGQRAQDERHYADPGHEYDRDLTQYRVVNVKASDSRQLDSFSSTQQSSFDTAWGSSAAAHNRSFPSPVSGYESDLERSAVYSLNTSQLLHHPPSLPPDYHTALAERRYVINGTQSSSLRPVVDAEVVSRQAVGPAVHSTVSSSAVSRQTTLPSAGQPWHKTTIDFVPNARSERVMQSHSVDMAPLHQQRVKSYMVFNSMDDVRESHPVFSPPPLQRSNSQTFKSEKTFVVSSPKASASTSVPFQRTFSRDFETTSTARPTIRVNGVDGSSDVVLNDDEQYRREVYEEKSYLLRSETGHVMPESVSTEDLRVLRGKILIQNRLNESKDQDDFLDNMNVFDTSFHLGKDNPLYQSDPDIFQSLQQEEQQSQSAIGQEVTHDITFETVDKIAQRHRQGEVQLSPKPKRKQNLSSLLLSKLASIDSKDIRQHIDVQHHNEEIYGDVALVHADGSRARNAGTSNFDSINENVELVLKQGKAFVIIKVIAERIVPIDYEFNVWRKSQAIVTRNIEIDLHATEQRRRLYEHVMETAGRSTGALEGAGHAASFSYAGAGLGASARDDHERQLSSLETLRLFSQILDVADGKGDKEDTEMSTRQEMGMLPGPSAASAMDLLY